MNRIGPGVGLLLGLVAGVACAQQTGDAPDGRARVAEVVGDAALVKTYAMQGVRFRHVGQVQRAVLLRAPVLEVSPKGYLRLDVRPDGVWIDRHAVRVEGTVVDPMPRRCVAVVSQPRDAMAPVIGGLLGTSRTGRQVAKADEEECR